MQFRIFTEPQQGASYSQLLAVAQAAESHGFDGFFRSDHFMVMGDGDGMPGPTHAWVTLAALARDTSTIRLGTLVSPITFYRPGPLAISVAQVDEMSGGRVELGIGAGWYEAEHAAYGIPFPATGERMSRLEEAVEQIVGLWTTPMGETYSHDGVFHQMTDSPALPKPVQAPHPPIIIGGRGKKRTPALAARYASDFNLPFGPPADTVEIMDRVRAACETIGRDPDEITYSVAQVLCVGETEADVDRRAAVIGREPDELRENGMAGTVDQVQAKVEEFAALGVERMYLQVLDLADLDHIDLAGTTLIKG